MINKSEGTFLREDVNAPSVISADALRRESRKGSISG